MDECRSQLAAAELADLPRLIRRHRSDPRRGVADAVEAAQRRLGRAKAEDARLVRLAATQAALHDQGIAVVAGVDEVGRGAYAGPLTAAAVILPVDALVVGLERLQEADAGEARGRRDRHPLGRHRLVRESRLSPRRSTTSA